MPLLNFGIQSYKALNRRKNLALQSGGMRATRFLEWQTYPLPNSIPLTPTWTLVCFFISTAVNDTHSIPSIVYRIQFSPTQPLIWVNY